jgi:prepilin-type N-terminal cleavage/methylation domain-containing protein/prepilin-type processing-associated H-X9-DG protein
MKAAHARGFTLIELLVVVAIIALMISILLPSLAAAKRQARKAVCASNLHQIGIAMQQYAHDNADWYPSQSRNPNDDYNMVWEYGGYGTGVPGPTTVYYRASHKRPLFKYIYPEFFRCRDDAPATFDAGSDSVGPWEGTGTSYPMNGYNWDGYGTVFPRSYGRLGILDRKTSQVTNPKCTLAGEAVIDEFWSDLEPFPGSYTGRGAGWRWHDLKAPRANVVFADGSVSFVLANKTERARGAQPSYWWWEGKGYSYSFCPTHPSKRGQPGEQWYKPGA